ncbi:hypothetical protein BDR04DRAFT_570958 [Suillus decipiens]|nr:hypothetical protein BDR04DRAFT_570958 [Suillus decipiens]
MRTYIIQSKLSKTASSFTKMDETPTSRLLLPTDAMDMTNNQPTDLPRHWVVPDFKEQPIPSVLFRILCLISMGRPSLKYHWKSKISDDVWDKHRKTFVDRLSNTNIVAGLVLTTSAVFISTQPPPDIVSSIHYTRLLSFSPRIFRACPRQHAFWFSCDQHIRSK